MHIRAASARDAGEVLELYLRVSSLPGGLARLRSEVDSDYVEGFLDKALKYGLVYVAVAESGQIVGEIHAYTPRLFCFSHVLSDLTIAVDPQSQGMGVGRRIFERLMTEVKAGVPDISRVELIARESNAKAIVFYESLGFEREGEFRNRIRNVDGTFESDIPMAWTRA